MDQPTLDLTQCAKRTAQARRVGALAVRRSARLAMRGASHLAISVALWVAGGIVLLPVAKAQEAGGAIVIPGPGENNPAALADLAKQMQTAPAQRVGSAATLAAATAQSLAQGSRARDADPFTRAAGASGSIVIPGPGEPPAAPQMIRTSFKPGNGIESNIGNVPAAAGFDTLASRGEPPRLSANGKSGVVTVVAATPLPAAAPMPATLAAASSTHPVAHAVAPQNPQPAAAAQPAPLAGQQDAEAIRAAALAFLQQQSAGLPGRVEITVAPAFPRGLAACTTLEPFMPSGARLWGRMTVGVRCSGERPWTIYLQARISLHATYYLAARAMAPGEVFTAADLVARDGDLTGLPQAIVTDPSQAIGSVSLVRVAGGMPLRRDMLKSASAVSIGQTVRVVAAGEGFAISAEGSAMNNASPGQQIRVKTANGQIISGIVKDGSTVEIQL
jgi:flagella basal body P-ring formation protein FlgA